MDEIMSDCEKATPIVYISCAAEVRYSFVSHLLVALSRNGINDVFVDSDDLLSKEAQAKVESAKLSVMVLPGHRTVGLDKLREVLQWQRNNEQVMIPVLYRVGHGPFRGEWLKALQRKGFPLIHQSRNECGDSKHECGESKHECGDSKLVEDIVRDVNEKLLYMGRIGIHSKLLDVEKMVNKQPLGIRCVGIWGMLGIGKTTLAKAIVDQMSGGFDAHCFIEDFDTAIHENKVYRIMMEQLMKDKPRNSGTITKLSLRRELNYKRVLVVLDDVRNPLLAESFLEGFDWFGPESLIIITSRDKQVFRFCEINQIYEVQGLNETEALQLFSLYVPKQDIANQNLNEFSMKVIEYAHGNPLALKVYGGELKGEKKLSDMETAFLKLKRCPPSKILDAFRSSYDTLSDSEKNIFLDIACFFQGNNVDYVMKLLEGCGFFPQAGIHVLVEKCLMTISENKVRMHNLIQDVGRGTINGVKARRSRLWEPARINNLLEDNKYKATDNRDQRIEEIEGIFLDTSRSIDVKPAAFENMLNLRLLKIYCSNRQYKPVINIPEGSLHSLPNELRLLHWENYPLQSFPQNFDPRYLVEINMPYSQLQTLWGGTKNLEMLRTIRLCHSQQLVNVDDLLKAQNLEVIDLQGCTRLKSFPATGQLLHLQVVNLSGCTEIKILPEVPPNIETLDLEGTGIRELPISAGKPKHTELVNRLSDITGLSGVSNLEQIHLLTSLLKEVSSSSQDLAKLIRLTLKHCSRLQRLPDMLNLDLIKDLDLSGCSELETIKGFPRNLKKLYLAGTAVREVPQLPQSLELLNAHGCVSLKSIRLDSKQLPMRYTFSNCFDLSPQVINDFLLKALANVKHLKREPQQELSRPPAFSFSAPSHTNQDSILDLQVGSSVMILLHPSWRDTLVGFAMLVEVAFSEDYAGSNGFAISCVCRWKNKEGHSHRIEKDFDCWDPPKAIPNVRRDHMFVFCDVNMRPSIDEGNESNIWADLVVFEFFPRSGSSCRVIRCGVYVIAAETGKTSLKMSSPDSSMDPMDVSGNEDEEVLRVSYDGLLEIDKALFLNIAWLFNDENVGMVAPLIPSVEFDIGYGINNLADRSLVHVSSNGEIVMHSLLRKMGKEILQREFMLTKYFEKVSVVSSSSGNWKYDVFLSFSRQDVHKNFLSHLLKAFGSKGITTFIDTEIFGHRAISPGFVQAMKESNISIVIFSEDYASLSWNLNELVEISKSKEELFQKLITIFYHVDPSDVRKQRGEFGRRFKTTCENKTADEKQQWCQALTDVANLNGYCSKNWDNEADMMDTIVDDVSRKLNITASEDFGDIVGIEDHISKMNTLLCLESMEVRMVGICGPSGVGKSTIARALCSRLACQFQRSIFVDRDFIEKTMENSRRTKLDDYDTKLHLQTQFLSENLGQRYIEVHHLGMVGEMLKDQKVLIILDDVDDLVVLDALVRQTRWFGQGSRIILSTEDKSLLMSHRIYNIYEVDLPSKKQALQIFYQYALRRKSPSLDFPELGNEVARVVGNLPLALKVMGSSLQGTDEAEWMDIFSQISDYRYGETWRILKLAYDRLDDHDKDIFLFIACGFNNYMVEYATQLLTNHHLNVRIGLTRLAEKSFIHISEHGNIRMHCLLQGFGKTIVRTMSSSFPASQFLNADKTVIIKEKMFREINLEVMPSMTLKIRPEVLVRIAIEASKLENLWNGVQPLGSLKRMSLQGSLNLLEIPDLSQATNLEKLDLDSCSSLLMLPSSIRNVYELRELNMKDCITLNFLPTDINLEYIYFLNLKGCSQLRSFPEISTNISDLYLDGTSIEEVPCWIENISGLSYLSMNGCKNLKKISGNISNLKRLVEVDFSDCGALTEDSWQNHPTAISPSLMTVNMSGYSFERLPNPWTSNRPKDFIFSNCRNLVSLPQLPASLSTLTANNCESLESLCDSLRYPRAAIQLINCFKLDYKARVFILQSNCAYAILPGGELPADFTHRPRGGSLTISLPQSSLSKKLLSFKACMIVEFTSGWLNFGALWQFRGGNYKQYVDCRTTNPSMSNHLIVFNCEFALDEVNDSPAELKHSDLQVELFCYDHRKEKIQIKECGIQLLEVSPFAKDVGESSEFEYGNDSEENSDGETRSSKRARIM